MIPAYFALVEITPFNESFLSVGGAFLIALAITIIIEELVGLFFFNPKTHALIIALVQCLTNPLLNLILFWLRFLHKADFIGGANLEGYTFSYIILIILLEIVVIFAEAKIYLTQFPNNNRKNANSNSRKKIYTFSIVANLASAVVGGVILYLLNR